MRMRLLFSLLVIVIPATVYGYDCTECSRTHGYMSDDAQATCIWNTLGDNRKTKDNTCEATALSDCEPFSSVSVQGYCLASIESSADDSCANCGAFGNSHAQVLCLQAACRLQDGCTPKEETDRELTRYETSDCDVASCVQLNTAPAKDQLVSPRQMCIYYTDPSKIDNCLECVPFGEEEVDGEYGTGFSCIRKSNTCDMDQCYKFHYSYDSPVSRSIENLQHHCILYAGPGGSIDGCLRYEAGEPKNEGFLPAGSVQQYNCIRSATEVTVSKCAMFALFSPTGLAYGGVFGVASGTHATNPYNDAVFANEVSRLEDGGAPDSKWGTWLEDTNRAEGAVPAFVLQLTCMESFWRDIPTTDASGNKLDPFTRIDSSGVACLDCAKFDHPEMQSICLARLFPDDCDIDVCSQFTGKSRHLCIKLASDRNGDLAHDCSNCLAYQRSWDAVGAVESDLSMFGVEAARTSKNATHHCLNVIMEHEEYPKGTCTIDTCLLFDDPGERLHCLAVARKKSTPAGSAKLCKGFLTPPTYRLFVDGEIEDTWDWGNTGYEPKPSLLAQAQRIPQAGVDCVGRWGCECVAGATGYEYTNIFGIVTAQEGSGAQCNFADGDTSDGCALGCDNLPNTHAGDDDCTIMQWFGKTCAQVVAAGQCDNKLYNSLCARSCESCLTTCDDNDALMLFWSKYMDSNGHTGFPTTCAGGLIAAPQGTAHAGRVGMEYGQTYAHACPSASGKCGKKTRKRKLTEGMFKMHDAQFMESFSN